MFSTSILNTLLPLITPGILHTPHIIIYVCYLYVSFTMKLTDFQLRIAFIVRLEDILFQCCQILLIWWLTAGFVQVLRTVLNEVATSNTCDITSQANSSLNYLSIDTLLLVYVWDLCATVSCCCSC